MTDVRIAVQLHPQQGPYEGLRDSVAAAEEMGVDIVYNWDHFFPLYGDPDGPHFECWTVLGAWAEQTSRIEFGPLVACNSYRNPNLLADMARTVDHISGGRLIFGIGSGWFERDYDEYGYEFGTAVSRLRDLERALPVIRERFDKLNPPPVRRIPILIGGAGEKITLKLVAQHADVWHSFVPVHDMPHKLSVLDKWCAEVGRDRAEITVSVGVHPHRVEADLDAADGFYELGVREFTIGLNGPEWDVSLAQPWLEWRDSK